MTERHELDDVIAYGIEHGRNPIDVGLMISGSLKAALANGTLTVDGRPVGYEFEFDFDVVLPRPEPKVVARYRMVRVDEPEADRG